jgi:hypothetical protein
MKPVEQFLTEYFRERTALYEKQVELQIPFHGKFFAAGTTPFLSQSLVEASKLEAVQSVSHSEGVASVVTTGDGWKPIRYQIRPSGEE